MVLPEETPATAKNKGCDYSNTKALVAHGAVAVDAQVRKQISSILRVVVEEKLGGKRTWDGV